MAVGQRDGHLYFLDILNRKATKNLQLGAQDIFGIEVFYDKWLAATKSGNLLVGNLATLELEKTIKLSDESLRCIAISNHTIAIGASDNNVYLLDTNFKLKQVLEGSENSVFTLLFLNEYTLLSGGRDAHLRIWVKNSFDWELDQSIPAHNYTINKIVYNPDLKLIATGSRDKNIRIWDSNDLTLLKVISKEKFKDGHTHSVNTLLWMSNKLLSAGDDKRIFIWEVSK